MIELPITLCAVDCAQPLLTLRALDISMRQTKYADVVLLTDQPGKYELPGCRMVEIPHIASRAEYSRFVIRELGQHFQTSHILLIQWDGYLVHPDSWRAEFLDYDYIGAPWGAHHNKYRVGNGGFSLRSRKLQDALVDPAIVEYDPEDEVICRRYRPFLESLYGIQFAPEPLAAHFSFETTYPEGSTLGFHGLFNMWMFIHPKELLEFVSALSARSVAGPQFLRLGQNYLELGRKDEAVVVLKRRLAVTPDDELARKLFNAAKTMPSSSVRRNDPCPCGSGKRYKYCCGNDANTVPSITSNTVDATTLLNEAMRHHQGGRLVDAEALYGQVVRLDPDNTQARHYLGVLAMQHGDAVRGETMIREALTREASPAMHNNLGLCLRMQNRLEDALASYRTAIAMQPEYVEAWNNLGLDLLALGRVGESIRACQRAIELRPSFAEAHWNLGLAQLTLGDYASGWQEYEWRLRCQPFSADGLALGKVIPWQGESLADKTLLVRREQGIGDTFQFLRFLPELRKLGGRILLDVPTELEKLACSVVADEELLDRTQPPPNFDYYVNLLSLPLRLGVTLESLPGETPYVFAEPNKVVDWHEYFGQGTNLKVGLVWAGNPKHKNDRNRSCPLSELLPLLKVPDIRWFSLQKGIASEQLKEIDSQLIVNLDDQLVSFDDTAAAIMSLDLVITVDTSVAHLAGALGRPVWIMLPFAPDWRWLLGRNNSPWYPCARLFRQNSPGAWNSVTQKLLNEINLILPNR